MDTTRKHLQAGEEGFVTVDSSDFASVHIRQGQPAMIYVDALPGKEFIGTFISIAPSATISNNVPTYAVKIPLDNAEQLQDEVRV